MTYNAGSLTFFPCHALQPDFRTLEFLINLASGCYSPDVGCYRRSVCLPESVRDREKEEANSIYSHDTPCSYLLMYTLIYCMYERERESILGVKSHKYTKEVSRSKIAINSPGECLSTVANSDFPLCPTCNVHNARSVPN